MPSKLEDTLAELEARDAADAALGAGQPADAEAGEADGGAGDADAADAAAGDAGAAGAADAGAAAAGKPDAGKAGDDARQQLWDKTLQQWQQDRSELARKVDQLATVIAAQGGKATPAQADQVQEAQDQLALLEKKLEGDFDAFEEGKPVLKQLVGELRSTREQNKQLQARLDKLEKQTQALGQNDAAAAQAAQAQQFWRDWEAKNPGIEGQKLFDQGVAELQKKGYQGEALDGAAEVLWEQRVAAAIAAKKTAPNPQAANGNTTKTQTAPSAAAAHVPGDAMVSSDAGAKRRATVKSAKQQIEDGDVDFFPGRKFGR